jgi:hypothetical protein
MFPPFPSRGWVSRFTIAAVPAAAENPRRTPATASRLSAFTESVIRGIYQFGPAGVERVAYEDTEHYRITRSFLSNPARMLKMLFED